MNGRYYLTQGYACHLQWGLPCCRCKDYLGVDSHGHIDQFIGKHKNNFFNTMNFNKCVCL